MDTTLRLRLTAPDRLERQLQLVVGRRVGGIDLFRRLVTERPSGTITPESQLETKFLRWLKDEGIRPPERQVKIFDGNKFVARVDLCYPDKKLIIEVQSYTHHHGRASWDKDQNRLDHVEDLGYRVLHGTSTHVRTRDQVFLNRLKRLLH